MTNIKAFFWGGGGRPVLRDWSAQSKNYFLDKKKGAIKANIKSGTFFKVFCSSSAMLYLLQKGGELAHCSKIAAVLPEDQGSLNLAYQCHPLLAF